MPPNPSVSRLWHTGAVTIFLFTGSGVLTTHPREYVVFMSILEACAVPFQEELGNAELAQVGENNGI